MFGSTKTTTSTNEIASIKKEETSVFKKNEKKIFNK